MENKTIEQRVAAAILEKATDSIEIGGEVYPLGDPCMATLILVSELISTMPIVEKVPREQILYSALHYAKDFKSLGELCAILVLGAGHLTEDIEFEKEIVEYRRFLGVFRRKIVKTVETVTVDKKAALAREFALNVRPSTKEIGEYERFLGVFRCKIVKTVETVTVDKKAALAREISLNLRPSVVFDCIIQRLKDMEVAHFFSIITSLSEANILKPTREVANP